MPRRREFLKIMDLPIEKKGWGKGAGFGVQGSGNNGERSISSSSAGNNGKPMVGDHGSPSHDKGDSIHRPRIKLTTLAREVRFENIAFTYPGACASDRRRNAERPQGKNRGGGGRKRKRENHAAGPIAALL